MAKKQTEQVYHVIGGGTVSHVRSHFALTATAYGSTARKIDVLLKSKGLNSQLHLTKMASAGKTKLETNEDIADLVNEISKNPLSKVIFFNPAIVDFDGQIGSVKSGKYATRLQSRSLKQDVFTLTASDKIVSKIKKSRPDIVLIAFKTTTGATINEQIKRGESLLKSTSADFVLANDTGVRRNIILDNKCNVIYNTMDREKALQTLVDEVCQRSVQKYETKINPNPNLGKPNV